MVAREGSVAAVVLKGRYPLQYRSNRRLVWFAANPGKVLRDMACGAARCPGVAESSSRSAWTS